MLKMPFLKNQLKLTFILFFLLEVCYGFPISGGYLDFADPLNSIPNHIVFLISGAAVVLLIYVVAGCVCCPNKSIKALTYQNGFPVGRLNENALQYENQSEFTIFPPQSTVIDLQPVPLPFPGVEERVTFEPLPDILPRKLSNSTSSSRPAHFRSLLKHKVSLHDWFDDPNSNFPRDQLQYINELGCGWFGRVVEGEAANISNAEETTKVMVKILREEATPSEHLNFLYEARPYRDLIHPNVVRLLGRCLESDPFLLIIEYTTSDLKTYLLQQDKREALVKNGILLRMAYNIAAGLRHLHKSGFIHADVAAHNCFVGPDMTVKVGDYGTSFDLHKDDYYCLGDVALPLRWYSPETLQCTEATIETKEIPKEANVWAFGIVMWEIFEFGKLPYGNLTDEDVLQKVLIDRTVQLPPITSDYPLKDELYLIMKECWKDKSSRPTMHKVENFLIQLYNDRHNQKMLESFEERWNSLQPKSTDSRNSSFRHETDFPHNYSSDGDTFSSFEVSYDMLNRNMNSRLSPSLNVLNGSIDELTENDACLKSVSLGCEKSLNDGISVASDRDTSYMEDDVPDHPGTMSPEEISSALMDLDLVLAAQSCANSRQSTLEHSHKSNDPFSSLSRSDRMEISEFAYLDRNSNEMDHYSFNENLSSGNKNQKHDIINLIPNGDVNSNVEDLQSHIDPGLCNVPDIVVHQVSLLEENLVEKEESVPQNSFTAPKPPKPFRFIFDTDSPPNEPDIKHNNNFDPEVPHVSLDSLKKSQPLTSTPLKSSNDSHNHSDSTSEVPLEENVFFKDFILDDEKQVSLIKNSEFKIESNCNTSTDVENSDIFTTKQNFVENFLKDTPEDNPQSTFFSTQSNTSISTTDYYTSAQSALDTAENNISLSNGFSGNGLCGKVLEADTSVSNCALQSPREDNDDSKCPLAIPFTEVNGENMDVIAEKANLLKESATPEISIESCDKDKVVPSKDSPYYDGRFTESATPDNSVESADNAKAILANLSPYYDGYLTPEPSLNSADLKYSSAESTPFSFSESFSNSRAETNSSTSQNVFDQYIGMQSKREAHSEQFSVSPYLDENRMHSVGNSRNQKSSSSFLNYSSSNNETNGLGDDHEEVNWKRKPQLCFQPYDEVVVEDLETGEQTIITENFSNCDDYENSGESDEILKIDIETDEAIIVDSSEALVGFVPSRSIELLQECEILPALNLSYSAEDSKESNDEEKESSDFLSAEAENSNSSFSSPGFRNDNSPAVSPNSSYAIQQPFRNFCLQNEIIEEEITEELASPASIHSTASFSSNEIFEGGEERMSESSESFHQMEGACETSILPVMEHFYSESDDGSKTDISNSCSEEVLNIRFVTDVENNVLDDQDVMHSWQPTQSIRWNSDETLEVEGDNRNPVIIESQEILAGSNGITMEDITSALAHMGMEDHLNVKALDRLRVSRSPSPYSSAESSPCRDSVYTPDFESESDETGGGSTSCSSTSGSFECIHNKFKDMVDVSTIADDSDPSCGSSREQSPMKVFSGTWDCHATPNKSLLVTPDKKFNSMRKSVSFHEEDPQVVFEYPPASYSSEDEDKYVLGLHNIDYTTYADWELQAGENESEEIEEVLEIEELDSEPYVRRPTYPSRFSSGALDRPTIYSFTSEFSDDDYDSLEHSVPPANSPEEEKKNAVSDYEMKELICNQLNNLVLEEQRLQGILEDDSSDLTTQQTPSHDDAAASSVHENLAAKYIVDVENNDFESFDENLYLVRSMNAESLENLKVDESELFKSSETCASIESNNCANTEIEVTSLDGKSENVEGLNSETSSCTLEAETKSKSFDASDKLIDIETELSSEKITEDSSINTSEMKDSQALNKHPISCEEVLLQNLEFKPDFNITDSQFEHNKQIIRENNYSSLSLFNSISLPEASVLEDKQSDSVGKSDQSDCLVDQISVSNKNIDFIENNKNLAPATHILNFDDPSSFKINNSVAESETLQTENNHTELETSKKVDSDCFHNVSKNRDYSNAANIPDIIEDESSRSDYSNAVNIPDRMEDESSQSDYSNTANIPDRIEDESSRSDYSNAANIPDIIKDKSSRSDYSNAANIPDIIEDESSRSTEQQIEKESAFISKSNVISNAAAESVNVPATSTSDAVPEIVITPASGSEIEEEEYLLKQLELFHAPDSDDFSVTPQYASGPFEDLFGARLQTTESSTDYPEAFNFEFHSGDFFEDIIDNYLVETSSELRGNSSDPVMMERSVVEPVKIDASPSYYETNDTTHL